MFTVVFDRRGRLFEVFRETPPEGALLLLPSLAHWMARKSQNFVCNFVTLIA